MLWILEKFSFFAKNRTRFRITTFRVSATDGSVRHFASILYRYLLYCFLVKLLMKRISTLPLKSQHKIIPRLDKFQKTTRSISQTKFVATNFTKNWHGNAINFLSLPVHFRSAHISAPKFVVAPRISRRFLCTVDKKEGEKVETMKESGKSITTF